MSEPICKCPFCNNDMFAVGDIDWGFTWIHDTPKSDCPLFTTMPNSVIFPSEKAIINAFSSRPIEDALRAENERLRKALEVYADEKNWKNDDWGLLSVFSRDDGGVGYGNPTAIAREALEVKG